LSLGGKELRLELHDGRPLDKREAIRERPATQGDV